jgi:hypothetical protein
MRYQPRPAQHARSARGDSCRTDSPIPRETGMSRARDDVIERGECLRALAIGGARRASACPRPPPRASGSPHPTAIHGHGPPPGAPATTGRTARPGTR